MRIANDRQALDDFQSRLKIRNHRVGEFPKQCRGWNRSFSIREYCADYVLHSYNLNKILMSKFLRFAEVNVDLFYAGQVHAAPYNRAFFAAYSLGSHECPFLAQRTEKT